MSEIRELLRQGRYDELWRMGCGFIDLSLDEFMAVQERLLLEQLELLQRCSLGRKLLKGAMPESVDEFRRTVPLTTYADYCPELLEKREDVLPVKPILWMHTSGRSVEYEAGKSTTVKWIPMSPQFYRELARVMLGCGIFATCKERGDVSALKIKNPKYLYAVAPRPYASGTFAYIGEKELKGDSLPPLAEAEALSFEERIQLGFQQALAKGLDYFFGLSSVLVLVGERLRQQSGAISLRSLLLQPAALLRVLKAVIKSKLARRPMLPRDIWSVGAIMCSGVDSSIFREKIKELWGRYPLEVYAGTEGGIYATQTWDYGSLTFVPTLNFFEFIPEAESARCQEDPTYRPRTVLLNEVKPGECYEVVITNLHGGIMTRYRLGDVVRITSMRNEKLGIDIPQMVFERCMTDLIDIPVLGRLTERILWQAIDGTGIPYEDWVARKEVSDGEAKLHVYLELAGGYVASEKGVATAICNQLIELQKVYAYQPCYGVYSSPQTIIQMQPVKVTLLPRGSFANYVSQRRAEGADLAHLKPPHLNPSDKVLSLLGAKVRAVPPEVEVMAPR